MGNGDIARGFADPRWATRLDELQIGINWWPNKYVRVSFDWVYDRFNRPIPWPVNDNETTNRSNNQNNPIRQYNLFWTRLAFFF